MSTLGFSLKAIEDSQLGDKEDAIDILLLRVFLMVHLKATLHLRLKLRVHLRLQLRCT